MVDCAQPVTTTFELQRQMIKQSQDALEQSIEFQKRFNEAVVDGMAGQKSAQRRAVELGEQFEALREQAQDVTEQVRDIQEGTLDP